MRDLEAKLAEAKAEAGTAKASRVRSRATAADTKKKLDFDSDSAAGAPTKAPIRATMAATTRPVPYWMSVAEAVVSMLLPSLIIFAVTFMDNTMPCKPGDDMRLHALAR